MITKSEMKGWVAGDSLKKGVYVHGRMESVAYGLNTGFVTETTQSLKIAEAYGSGSIWAFEIPEDTQHAEDNAENVHEDFLASIGRFCPEIDRLIDCYSGSDGLEKFEADINPPEIVDCAGLWDSDEFVCWYWDQYERAAVITADGAVILDIEAIPHYGINRAEYDA